MPNSAADAVSHIASAGDWQGRRVAIVLSPALGDTLLTLIVANNLARAGAQVTTFGAQAWSMKEWFSAIPGLTIAPPLRRPASDGGDTATETPEAAYARQLQDFDLVIQLHAHQPIVDITALHPRTLILESLCNQRSEQAMVDRLHQYCRDALRCADAVRDNGLRAPDTALVHRRHRQRVGIHPTASSALKRWLPERFIALALRLRAAGFEPYLILAPNELAEWQPVLQRAGVPAVVAGSLTELAAWLYEAGWFIGNDSGIGHLASNLGIPALSLFMRRGIARTWRPSWGPARVIVAGNWIPTGKLKERFWKQALSVNAVLRAFDAFRAEISNFP